MAEQEAKRPLTILHTNDFHNRLPEGLRSTICRLRAEAGEPLILLDAGDAGGSTNITFRPGGEPILDGMSDLGYSAMTVGNRDFHVSRMGFNAKLFRAGFPLLCANIRPSRLDSVAQQADVERPLAISGAREPDVRGFVFSEPGHMARVSDRPNSANGNAQNVERKLSAYIFDPPIATAAQIVPALQERFNPDFTAALTHIGLRLDRELAAADLGIDLIVGGHSHEVLSEGETIGTTTIVQAGSHGRHVGVVTVDPAELAGGRNRVSARLVTV